MNEREALKLALEALKHYEQAGLATLKTIDAFTAIKEALAQPEQIPPSAYSNTHQTEQEPVAFDFQKALRRAYHLGQNYWADADSESYSANKRADKHRQDFDALCAEALANTAPPQQELVCVCGAVWEGQELVSTPPQRTWVGLIDEDKQIAFDDTQEGGGFWEFADAIEAKLKEKNT